jgi:putative cardiolipin synthase
MVVDQRYVFIGSANIDPRSNTLNTEIGVMVDSRELAQQTTQLFDRTSSLRNSYLLSIQEPEKDNAISHSNKNKMIWLTEEQNKRVHYIKEPNASFMRKLVVNIMGLLPFESLL